MRRLVLCLIVAACWPVAAEVRLEIEPQTATVGDPLVVRMTIDGEPERTPQTLKLGPELGPFHVLEEGWVEEPGEEASGWVWSASVAAYELGELEFPALNVPAVEAAGEGWSTDPRTVSIGSVIEEQETTEGEPEIADLKGPAALDPDLSPVMLAAVLFGLFVAVAALAWWLYRRYAARLAAAPAVEDPFARIPPHEWAFEALRELLDRRAEYPRDRFYERLSWILKRYLGGRYRIDLLEQTTDEARPLLDQAGAPGAAVTRVAAVLADCDAVKFAKHLPSDTERKDVVERVYGIIDRTKPVEPTPDASQGAA